MTSLTPFIRDLRILDKDGIDVRFGDVMSYAQEDLLERVNQDLTNRIPSRYIILKARQIGISTMVEGIQFAMAMARPNLQGLVVAHEMDSSAHLLNMMRHYYATFWARSSYPTVHAATNQLAWTNGSHIKISTAKNLRAGRSRTLRFLHASECGFWEKAEILMTGLQQAVPRRPGTFIGLESTANGVGGFFFNSWEDAMAGNSSYTPLFYPWWAHPEYTAHHIARSELARGALVFADSEEKQLYRYLSNSRRLNGRIVEPMDTDEIKSRLIWRREILASECQGDINRLHQEYPSEPEEAFIATGTNVFDLERLRKIYEPMEGERGRLVNEGGGVRFIPDPNGELEVFKFPSDSRQFGHYMIGGDPKKAVTSGSKTAGDYCCAQVLNRKTWEQVAQWRGRADQNMFGEQMILMGRWYNNAMLAPETGIGGPGTAAHIIAKGYPNIWQHRKATKMLGQVDNTWGWITNAQTKHESIGNLQSALFDATTEPAYSRGIGFRIHSATLFHEMKNYSVLPDGGYGNADGAKGNDDTVSAMAIALTCSKYEQALLQRDVSYQAPRYHAESYESKLDPQQAINFEGQLGELNVGEGPVMSQHSMMQEGAGFEAEWIGQEAADMYSEADDYGD